MRGAFKELLRDLAGRSTSKTQPHTTVAVVGAGGPSGLAVIDVLSVLRDAGASIDVLGFEAKSACGGVWNREENKVFPSRVYDGLRTNLPMEVMEYFGVLSRGGKTTVPSGAASFVTHGEVLEYIQQFADRQRLNRFISFDSNVVSVRKVEERGFRVVVSEGKGEPGEEGEKETVVCVDAVFVCTGHFNREFGWDLVDESGGNNDAHAGGATSSGGAKRLEELRVIHSGEYRSPREFAGHRVLVVGDKASGTDIAAELRTTARSVTVSRRNEGRSGGDSARVLDYPQTVPGIVSVLRGERCVAIEGGARCEWRVECGLMGANESFAAFCYCVASRRVASRTRRADCFINSNAINIDHHDVDTRRRCRRAVRLRHPGHRIFLRFPVFRQHRR